jgi:hypothetical protein
VINHLHLIAHIAGWGSSASRVQNIFKLTQPPNNKADTSQAAATHTEAGLAEVSLLTVSRCCCGCLSSLSFVLSAVICLLPGDVVKDEKTAAEKQALPRGSPAFFCKER